MPFRPIFRKEPPASTFKGDLSGAFLAAIIALPMALAFGVQSGLGPEAGLYTAIILAIVAGIWGGTKTLISDPTGPMTVVAATVVTTGLAQSGGDMHNALPLILATFLLAAVLELLFGVFDFGRFVKFMPYPVLSGFMAGIGCIIIAAQIFPILGLDNPGGFLTILISLGGVESINYYAAGLGALSVALVYLFPKITRQVPSILLSLVLCTLIAVFFELDVPVIGNIPKKLPALQLHRLLELEISDLQYIITPAVMLGGLGVIDSLLTSVVADNLTKTKHNSRMTVIGQGAGNFLAAAFGGLPGAGATMGTVTNINAGAQTKRSGILKGVILLLIVATTADYVRYIPMSVLGGILITVGASIIDTKGIKMLFRIPKSDAATWTIVLLVTLFDNLLNAVAIGFVASSLFFINKMSRSLTSSQESRTLQDFMGESQSIPAELAEQVYVQSFDGPMFFGFANRYREHCHEIRGVRAVIIRMERVPFMDQSGMVTLEDVITDWQKRGIAVYITGANDLIRESFAKVQLLPGVIGPDRFFNSFQACVDELKAKAEQD
ncbi:MAG: SulP family inorganic anion transporter [Phaeodactylibacter sp.]|uniref:SulP family inorganic anion transporter n=1 Tax=Phaeodactylibacter sp. TaxID=1940289 RepID=UPI0032F00ED2